MNKNNINIKINIVLLLFVLLISTFIIGIKAHAENNVSEEETQENYNLLSSGTSEEIPVYDISSLTNIKYIPNANYFKVNPYHARNDRSDNSNGTCTTVAMQMLLGYHNYYSYRKLIPELGNNNLRFLNEDYGKLEDNPKINTTVADD